MAAYTHLNRPEIEELLARFSIKTLTSYKRLSGGSENTNYLIVAAEGKYVLTLCEQKSFEEARDLAQLLEHLSFFHFETSRIVRNSKNESIEIWKGKPILLKKFVEGKILASFPFHLLELLGEEMGKLHQIKAPEYLPEKVGYGKEQFGKVKLYAADSDFDHWLSQQLDVVSPYLSLGLPRALIHSDIFCDNVVVSEDEQSLVIMDFEESAHYYRIFDLGMAFIGTCAEGQSIDFKKAGKLLKGYQKEIALLDKEIEALKAFTVYAGAAMTFWRHFNFNYIVPDPKLSKHYLGLKVLTDFIREQPADCFLNWT